jgi:hypothetical protein
MSMHTRGDGEPEGWGEAPDKALPLIEEIKRLQRTFLDEFGPVTTTPSVDAKEALEDFHTIVGAIEGHATDLQRFSDEWLPEVRDYDEEEEDEAVHAE